MRKQRGMSLVELVTAMLIVGILTAIAIPSYTSYMRKTRRADAKVALTNMAQQLERCYTRYNRYDDNPAGNCPTGWPVPTQRNTYQLSAVFAGDGQSYTLTATPLGKQALDTQCGNFTLTQANVQDVSVSGAATSWW